MGIPDWLLAAGLALLTGLAVGAALHAWWAARLARARRRIPAYWPLSKRTIANTEERRVWRWLSRAFFDHHVMIKLPVTRFTLPQSKDGGTQWYELLNSAYCTFTICNAEGRVVGCVDVPGHTGLSKSTRVLKQSLLDQCGIGYWVVTSGSLPALRDIRTEFLGEALGALEQRAGGPASGWNQAQDQLRATLEKKRTTRVVQFDPMTSDPARYTRVPGEEFDPEGEPNSFLAPLDSRLSDLR